MASLLDTARGYVARGLSVIPVKADGSKQPALDTWNEYRRRRAADAELGEWFGSGAPVGIAVVCGRASLELEVLDFDDPAAWEEWTRHPRVTASPAWEAFPRVRTPKGGRHLYVFRDLAGGNRKLAVAAGGGTRVEVRGEGGYVLAPGCPGACHPTGRGYEWEVPLAPAERAV